MLCGRERSLGIKITLVNHKDNPAMVVGCPRNTAMLRLFCTKTDAACDILFGMCIPAALAVHIFELEALRWAVSHPRLHQYGPSRVSLASFTQGCIYIQRLRYVVCTFHETVDSPSIRSPRPTGLALGQRSRYPLLVACPQ